MKAPVRLTSLVLRLKGSEPQGSRAFTLIELLVVIAGKRVIPLLFADNHIENFTFPPSYESASPSTLPDMNWKFW